MKNGNQTHKVDDRRIVDFLYELGTMRKIQRAHRQTLMIEDASDNISSHSYRVTMIAWFLAREEGADPYKTVMMALLHDVAEIRTNDHNWVHKRYVKIFEEEIDKDQLGDLPYNDLFEFIAEYRERKSIEAVLAKDADLLEQVFLLREHEMAGNKEAALWLTGKGSVKENMQIKKMKSETAKRIGLNACRVNPSDWWNEIWTSKNR